MSALERSLGLEWADAGARARADEQYEANTGMFGGWTSAIMLKAVLEHPDSRGTASAISVNFIGRIAPGEALKLAARPLGGSRSLTHWRCDVHCDGTQELLATATIVLAQRRESERAVDLVMPAAAEPDSLPPSRPPGPFGRTVDTRVVRGDPPFNRPDMRSLSWVRETTGRPMDPVQLAFLSDVYAPRVFSISTDPRPSSTVTLSIAFLAGMEEITRVGDDYILAEVEGTRIEQAQVGSRSQLWSRHGTLLATSEQLCWFR